MAARILIGLAALAVVVIRHLARDAEGEADAGPPPPRPRTAVPKKIGFRPGSIGDISSQIGYDVRDLIVAGYSQRQIQQVVDGRMTLEELLRTKPEKRKA